ncbi:hypothetical protein BDV19DRAFT_394948 [Aspergillus venezuelensis]
MVRDAQLTYAVYSRSQKTALEFGTAASADANYDSPSSNDRSLTHLLARSDIEAVIIAREKEANAKQAPEEALLDLRLVELLLRSGEEGGVVLTV